MKKLAKSINKTGTLGRGTSKRANGSVELKLKDSKHRVRADLRTLLVPVDFSVRSLEALDFAVSLAQELNASILLLHVLNPLYTPGRFDSRRLRPLRAEALRDAKLKLAKLATRRVKPYVPVRHQLLKGVAYSGIVECAAKANADLIVMASEGRTRVSRFLIGSVTEKVIRHAPCSVMIVRDKAR